MYVKEDSHVVYVMVTKATRLGENRDKGQPNKTSCIIHTQLKMNFLQENNKRNHEVIIGIFGI